MGRLRHILIHVATPSSYSESAGSVALPGGGLLPAMGSLPSRPEPWIEGEPGSDGGPQPVKGASFPAVLFLPQGQEDTDRPRSRKFSRPTLLYEPVNADTGLRVQNPTADDELLVKAPELAKWTGAVEARWQVDGMPQPFGKPGRVIGVQVTLKQVTD